MQLYTISKTTNLRESIIETFDSFIWTERYSSYGDVQLVVPPSQENLTTLMPGTFLGIDVSDRIMIIDSVEKTEDSDGKKTLNITGTSFENIFSQRVAKKTLTTPDWVITGTPGYVIKNMVDTICIAGTGISSTDIIPNLTSEDLSLNTTSYDISIKTGTLYERIKQVADDFYLGFRVVNVLGGNKKFEIYQGQDLTGTNGVAFSEELDNLSETSVYKSEFDYRNVAYVLSKNGSVIVNRNGTVNPTTSGLDRKVLFVDATDVEEPAGTKLTNILKNRGKQELAYREKLSLFDGVVDPNGIFQYKRDYDLGDLVSFRGDDNVKETMMVTEYIFTYDSNGYRAYPTLSL